MTQENRQDYWRYSTVGLEYTVMFGLGLAAGYLVDIFAHTLPGFLILGGTIGFLAGTYRLVRRGKRMTQQEMQRLSQERQERQIREQRERDLEELRERMYREKEAQAGPPDAAGPPGSRDAGEQTGDAD